MTNFLYKHITLCIDYIVSVEGVVIERVVYRSLYVSGLISEGVRWHIACMISECLNENSYSIRTLGTWSNWHIFILYHEMTL